MHNKGLWLDNKTFINFTADKTSLTSELATRKGAMDFYSLGSYLPNPDPVLKKQGKDIRVYRDLMTDAHLSGCVSSRKAGVRSLEWSIDRGKSRSRQAKVIEEVFKMLEIDQIISEILNAPLFGYQALEVIWEASGNYILPVAVTGKPQEWFVFGEENELRLRTRLNYNGEPIPERKFLLAQHEAEYNNPYGSATLAKCFWPVTFKKGGLKFWVIFTEKYGMPFLIGKQPRGTGPQDTTRFADMLEAMVQDAVAIIPDDASVERLESKGAASSGIYSQLLEFCKSEVSIAMLGQNLSTEVKGGSFAASQSHMQVRADIVDADRKLVERVLNTLINWICELNFPPGERPVFSMYEEEDVDKDLAERDKLLVDAGVKFTRQYWMREYGFEEGDIEIAPLPVPQQFTETASPQSQIPNPQLALDAALESISPEELQLQMEGVLKPVITLIKEGNDYNAIMEQLVSTYPDMEDKALEEMLSRAIFISETWGRING